MEEQVFTIIVADDEAELREAVCSMIPWETLGFRLAGSAGNGLDALQLVEQLQPDLLLTDIQMPFITGTALARQVRELQPLIQVAFLSGYDDFEYAQSAIESDVIAYLLKPISMAELSEALREIHRKMAARFDALRPSGDPGKSGSLQLAAASLLLDRFNEQQEEQELRRMLSECGMDLGESCEFTVLAMRAGDMKQDAAQTADKVLRDYFKSCSIVSGGRVLSLLVSADGFAHLGAALDELYYVGKRLLGEPCTIGASRSFSRLQRCALACREAADALREAEESGIFYVSELQTKDARQGMSYLCDRALQIIEQNYMDEELSLGTVSEQLHVSPNYLSANMKKYTGDTFINLLIKRRMDEALYLLQSSGMKVAEVAARCGYSDQHYFSYCFKKYHGTSPAKMRRREENG